MSGPKETRQYSLRVDPDLHARLGVAAKERNISVNQMLIYAAEDFLERMIPADEIRYTRESVRA